MCSAGYVRLACSYLLLARNRLQMETVLSLFSPAQSHHPPPLYLSLSLSSSPLSQRIYRTIPGIFSPTFTNPTLPEKGGMPHTITGGEALHFGNLLMVANEPSFGQKPINKTNPRPDFCFCDLNWKRIASASLALQCSGDKFWRLFNESFFLPLKVFESVSILSLNHIWYQR